MQTVPWFWWIINLLARLVGRLRLAPTIRVEGPVPEGAVLLCAKHGTSFDIPLLADFTWTQRHSRPYFQMGSFVGYRVLGLLGPVLRRLGGFPVMRPKEALRLKSRLGLDREAALARMQEVNRGAEATREAVLRAGEVLVVFPEGTRDDARLRPVASTLELETALRAAADGVRVAIWPVVLSYGPRRFFRRHLVIDAQPPFPAPASLAAAAEVKARIEAVFARHWVPPEAVAALRLSPASPVGKEAR